MTETLKKIREVCEKAEGCSSCIYAECGECMIRYFIGNHLPRYWNLEVLEQTIKRNKK